MVRVAIGLVLILVIVGYSAFSVITTGQVLGIDARLFLVVAPVSYTHLTLPTKRSV